MASTTTELTWLSFILRDIGIPHPGPFTLFCDNISALYMTLNHVFHARTKHIEIDYHFVREKVALGSLVTWFVPSHQQVAESLPSHCLGMCSLDCVSNWECGQALSPV